MGLGLEVSDQQCWPRLDSIIQSSVNWDPGPCVGDAPLCYMVLVHQKETDKQEISKHMGLASSFHPAADVKSLGIQT